MAKMIDEKTAAEMAGCSAPTLRDKCKTGAWKIGYNSRHGRNYRYNEQHIKDLLNDPDKIVTGLPDSKNRWYQKKKAQLQTA